MVPVRPPPRDPERQVDLGRRERPERGISRPPRGRRRWRRHVQRHVRRPEVQHDLAGPPPRPAARPAARFVGQADDVAVARPVAQGHVAQLVLAPEGQRAAVESQVRPLGYLLHRDGDPVGPVHRKPWPRDGEAAIRSLRPGDRHARALPPRPVRPVEQVQRIRDRRTGQVGLRQPQLLPLIDQNRPGRGGQQEGQEPHVAVRPVPGPRRVPGLVVGRQPPAQPRRIGRAVEDVGIGAGGRALLRQVRRVGRVQPSGFGQPAGQLDGLVAGRHLAQEPGVLPGPAAQMLHEGQAVARQDVVDVVLVGVGHEGLARRPVLRVPVGGRVVGHPLVEEEAGHRVQPEAVDAAVQPEAHHVPQLRLHRLAAQVQRRLMMREVVQVVLPTDVVPRPGRRAELAEPVVRRRAVRLGVAPDVEGVVVGIPHRRPPEPGRGVGGVVEHLVGDDLEAQAVGARDQVVEILQRAQRGMDRHVVRDVVAAVEEGRRVEGADPDRVRAQRRHVVQLQGDPPQVARARAGRIAEGARVDLVDDGVLRPDAVGHGGRSAPPSGPGPDGPPARRAMPRGPGRQALRFVRGRRSRHRHAGDG